VAMVRAERRFEHIVGVNAYLMLRPYGRRWPPSTARTTAPRSPGGRTGRST
jgi:hypothetical protein